MTTKLSLSKMLFGLFLLTFNFLENESFGQRTKENLYPLTKNLFVNISGVYPSGYEPRWRLVGSPQQLQLNSEVYIANRSKSNTQSIPFGIVEYQGKTVVRMRALSACECVADIDLPNSKTILTNSPASFELINFRKVQVSSLDDPNAACKNMSTYTWGGWKGKIVMSSDEAGNIKFDLRLENFNNKGNLYWLLFGENLDMSNMVTPNTAVNNAIATENKVKEDNRLSEIYARKQLDRKYLDEQFNQKLKSVKARPSATTASLTTYKGYALKKTIDLEKLVGNNLSREDGVAEAYAIAKKGYYRIIGGFTLTFNANSFEPHERNGEFAVIYCLAKEVNNIAIDIATYALIGDKDKLIELGKRLQVAENSGDIVDQTDVTEVKGYLKSKD